MAQRQLLDLRKAMRTEGLGMSDWFTFDGDITSTALATLAEAGLLLDGDALQRFERDGRFITYQAELQPSLTTNAHALHALTRLGRSVPAACSASASAPSQRRPVARRQVA